jgi:hypothetical protein
MPEDWTWDPGYRPGDPRYGLSPEQLAAYYEKRPPQYTIRCTYGPDALSKREAAMAAHLSHIAAHRDRIRFAGPLLTDDGAAPTGTWFMIDAPDRAAAEAFIAGEGYNRAGMFAEVEIKRYASSKPWRQRDIAVEDGMQMFVCECIDGPDGIEIRKTTGPAHHEYQGAIMDRFVAHGPTRSDDGKKVTGSTFIIQVADRAAAEALVANEPMTQAGVFAEIRIDRWRFGKSLA